MRPTPFVLPPIFEGSSRLQAPTWAALAAAIPISSYALVGLYPQFDHGNLRILVAAITGPTAAAVLAKGLLARSAPHAFFRTLGLATVGGVACTILPAAALALSGGPALFAIALIFGVVFGGFTGFVYGLPLAALAAALSRASRGSSADAHDRAGRVAGLAFLVASLGLLALHIAAELGAVQLGGDGGAMIATVGPLMETATALAGVGLAIVVFTQVRLLRRARWLARVERGLEPALRLRPWALTDDDLALPRLRDPEGEARVLEWRPEAPSAYRAPAEGVPLGIM